MKFRILPIVAVLAAALQAPGAEPDADKLRAFAQRQTAAKLANKPIPQFSAAFPDASAADAEFVQKHYVRQLTLGDEVIAGIKGAVVGEGGQKFFGIDGPLSAVLFKNGWHDAKHQPKIPIREGANPGIETELGLILKTGIANELKSVEELKARVRALVPVIELPAGRTDWKLKPKSTDLIANNVGSDRYIVGEDCEDLSIDLEALPIQLTADGNLINDTTGGSAKGGQWANFLHQVNWAVHSGYELKADQLVITGALGKINKTGAGSYRAKFGDLGVIEFTLTDK